MIPGGDKRLRTLCSAAAPLAVFISVTFLLTFNILSLPYVVIGDNFAWTRANIVDILGPNTVLESYMGDISLLSTFKTGFLFPLTYIVNLLGLPVTLVYPFLFYLSSMLAFYVLSAEVLENRAYRAVVSIAYVVNPVTPYYYASILSAFTLVFLPLALKYSMRAFKHLDGGVGGGLVSWDFALCSFFLALSISAHEQFLPTIFIVSSFIALAFILASYHRYGPTASFVKVSVTNVLLFGIVVILVNTQELLTLSTIMGASFATYFTGRFDDWIANVRYTYATTDVFTLLRFGGDSGAGLMHEAWFDLPGAQNIFGYAIPILLALAVVVALRERRPFHERVFFWMCVGLFSFAFALLLFVGWLPSQTQLAQRVFDAFTLPLQSFETPAKLRVVLMLSALVASMYGLRALENFKDTPRRKLLGLSLLGLFALSTFAYNSPWAVSYPGYTTVQQISETLEWGDIYNERYSDISNYLSKYNGRGVIIPYTHRIELYAPPDYRLFQLFSAVNEQMTVFTMAEYAPLSKLLGLISAKYVVSSDETADDWLLFPKDSVSGVSSLEELGDDPNLSLLEDYMGFHIFENSYALPTVYASEYYVFYDEANTLQYALAETDFKDLPVFIGSGNKLGEITIPEAVGENEYDVYAVTSSGAFGSYVRLDHTNDGVQESLRLKKVGAVDGLDIFRATTPLSPSDILRLASDSWVTEKQIAELVLSSETYDLGEYDNAVLDFSVELLEAGEYCYLGPRVKISDGNSTDYFILLHNNGGVELGILRGSTYSSGIITAPVNQYLKDGAKLAMSVRKYFDQVEVFIGGELKFRFPIVPGATRVSLSSEASVSRFIDVSLSTMDVVRLFAVRRDAAPLDFFVTQSNAETSSLEVLNASSDYAVVVQYLNTPSRTMDAPVENEAIQANIFFNGWIVQPEDPSRFSTVVRVGMANERLAKVLLFYSLSFTWIVLIVFSYKTIKRRYT